MKKSNLKYQYRIPSNGGFTMLEMLVVIILFGLLAYVGLTRLASLTSSFNRVNARAWVLQDLKRAQAHTVTQGCRGILTISAGSNSYWYGCDYLSYDTTANPQGDASTFVRNLPDNITIAASAPIIFNSQGQTVDIDGIVSSTTISLSEHSSSFATGLLNGTGVFKYN